MGKGKLSFRINLFNVDIEPTIILLETSQEHWWMEQYMVKWYQFLDLPMMMV